MVRTVADTRTEDRVYAGIGAMLLLLLLFLALMWIVFTTPNPPYPEVGGGGGGGGIELSFGDAPVGMGNTNPDQLSGDVKANDDVQPDVLTQETEDDAPSLPPKVNKPAAPIKPQTPKVNNNALFTNKGGSQGSSNKPGNEGDPKGNPNALFKGGTGGNGPGEGGGEGGGKGNGKGTGEGDGEGPGKGTGKGGGINFSLAGRTGKTFPEPCYDSNVQGKVIVDVGVDENGNVVSTKIGRGTTVTDQRLQKCALEAAKRSKFSTKADAPEQQFGTITYTFLKR